MSDSIHAVRWISQVVDQGWELHLFSSHDGVLPCSGFKNITLHQFFHQRKIKDYKKQNPSVKFAGPNIISKLITIYQIICKRYMPKVLKTHIEFLQKKDYEDYQAKYLCYLIKKLRPDIIHSMEFQSGGYLTMEAKKRYKGKFPKWITTNWGSDIYLFGQLKIHEKRIKEMLATCDFYSCECARDVALARSFGFRGKVLPVFPNTGGFDLEQIKKFRTQGKTSKRKVIVLKGYQNWSGRALVGLRALERCADILKGYKIVIFSTFRGSDVEMAAEILTKKTDIQTKVVYETAHKNILKLQGQARLYIGLNISDAISTSLLEAMVMGAFPIQSNTSCACEWIENGKTGILVSPEDPEITEIAIRQALGSDKLVDEAARLNFQTAKKRLQKKDLTKEAINFYRIVFES